MFKYFLLKKFWEVWFSLSFKIKDTLKFLNNINSKNPKENSKPAKPKIKKVFDIKFKSSFIDATKIDKEYKTNQVISE